MTLRRKHFTALIAERHTFISEGVAAAAFDAIIEVMVEAAAEGHTIDLTPFGRFRVVACAARHGFDPATKTSIQIPAKNRVKFIADPSLKTPPLV